MAKKKGGEAKGAGKDKAAAKADDFDEATVFFEVVLPQLCLKIGSLMRRLPITAEFQLRARPPRAWTVRGGEPPWVTRGEAPDAAIHIGMSPDFVRLVVHGGNADIETAMAAGQLTIDGDLSAIKDMLPELRKLLGM